jgi:hypothetical protein
MYILEFIVEKIYTFKRFYPYEKQTNYNYDLIYIKF